ncbi:MAG TPA: TldD/PmbA family protein [Methanomicrobiales archaeon]|nr:TldD/PmbA family protein [Methanomicrobiales archaeon]
MPPAGIRFFDARRVRASSTHADIDNGIVESAGTSFSDISLVRVLGPKGWGMVSANNLDLSGKGELNRVLAEGLALARLTGDPVELAEPPRGGHRVPAPREDPGTLSLEEKTGVLAGIEKAAKLPGVTSTRATYVERTEEVSYTDSSGYEHAYTITRSGFSVLAVARRNGIAQMGRESLHTIHGFNLRHQEPLGVKAGETALALLDAGLAKGGRMRAVLDPELAGVFAHEAVGHASEGDLVKEGSSVLAGRIGERIGPDTLTIADDPALTEFGFEPVDAEGCRTARTEMVSRGRVNAYLHTRETLAALGNGMAGHGRAEGGDPPLVRMSNTFIETGDATLGEILAECGDGILLVGSRGGQVDPGRGVFQFNAEYGYLIENGEKTRMVRDVSLSGEILSTLHGILLCGNDRVMHQGYCGKGGQSVPVSDGSPHILLSEAVVGGSGTD